MLIILTGLYSYMAAIQTYSNPFKIIIKSWGVHKGVTGLLWFVDIFFSQFLE